ncbi:MAG: MATE family efflux transporter [Gammaproteobacteria bacterium]|nr:MATE family efflux transporter [Gammaproteobacteria bacterium]
MKNQKPRFVTGSIWRHVIVMTLANSIGLMTLFLVDLIDLYFLNLLGEQEMAASVGFSAQLLFFVTAISIGLLVAVGILVSQRIGAEKHDEAKRIFNSALAIACSIAIAISALLLLFLDDIFMKLGAKGRTFELAVTYSSIILPSSVMLVCSMVCSAALRGLGDAKRSMKATLLGALVNLALDPLLIFYFDMGIAGAAWASVISRITMVLYTLYSVGVIYHMLIKPSFSGLIRDFSPIAKIAGPSMLTNLATPIGSTFVMKEIALYGDAAVAAYATIGRIVPVAFSVIFALSGAISPIIGQNFGAKSYDRIREAYRNAIIFVAGYVFIISTLLFFSQNYLVSIFNLSGDAAQLLALFCSGLAIFFIADGALFSTNSVFNSLGYPLYSTIFNYAKFFLGVIPAAYVLSSIYGAQGVIIGQAIGPLVVTVVAIIVCGKIITNIDKGGDTHSPKKRWSLRSPLWPGSSSRTQV